jgi:pimeloyl-ACP methyl ester carboxylesterase
MCHGETNEECKSSGGEKSDSTIRIREIVILEEGMSQECILGGIVFHTDFQQGGCVPGHSQSRVLPKLDRFLLNYRRGTIPIPYLYREGSGPAILFIHGLGGAKENFHAAFQSSALEDCTLLAFDNPGTGLADFDLVRFPDVNALADVAQLLSESLMPNRYFVCAASMGGLIALLKFRHYGAAGLDGFVNIEGNLCSEDCMFSRRTAGHDVEGFRSKVFPEIISELLNSPFTGDRMIAHNMALNTDPRAYHAFSHETVRESDSGKLIDEFLGLKVPRLFLYGEINSSLSYLERLRESEIEVAKISHSAHFLFYDNPVDTFAVIGDFVHRRGASMH